MDADERGEQFSPSALAGERARADYEQVHEQAEAAGRPLFEDLMEQHREHRAREQAKMRRNFGARRRGIARIGLPQVRDHRIRCLERDEAAWREAGRASEEPLPDVTALVMLRVERHGAGGDQ